MGVRDEVSSADGTTIGIEIYGEGGPPLVVVPGALHSGHHYAALAEALSDAFTVYAVDRRGRPGGGPQRPDHGIDAECDDVVAVVKKTGSTRIFGHSSGGVVSLNVALRHPIERLAVYEPPIRLGDGAPTTYLDRIEAALAGGNKPAAMAHLVRAEQTNPVTRRLPAAVFAVLMRLAVRAEPHVGEYIDAVDTFPAEARMIMALATDPDRYRGIGARTLLLLGDRSQRYLAAASRLLAEEIPDSTLTVMAGLDHTAPDEKAPGRVAAELRRFFVG